MEEPQNLRSLFEAAKSEKSSLEARTDTNTDQYRSDVNSTIANLEECQRLISLVSLFSSNETLEDISTADLQYFCSLADSQTQLIFFPRYLTVDYFLADLLQRSYSSDRETLLRRAIAQYERYLARLDDYDLLSPSDKKLYVQFEANPAKFSLTPTNDAAIRREVKVNRLREEKELKQKLEVRLNAMKKFS